MTCHPLPQYLYDPSQPIKPEPRYTQQVALAINDPSPRRARQALAPISNNQIPNSRSLPAEKVKLKFEMLPAGQYLGFHEFEEMHCLAQEGSYIDKSEFRKARRAWLAKLEIDEIPYQLIRVEERQRNAVEKRWAIEPPEKRQDIERIAIFPEAPRAALR